jgi:gas vesicle protein
MQGLGLLIGGFGLGVGLLLAPTSGRKLRSNIGRGYRKAKKKIERKAESWHDHAEDLKEQAKHFQQHAEELRKRGIKLARGYRAA